jgi:hypothetical protein
MVLSCRIVDMFPPTLLPYFLYEVHGLLFWCVFIYVLYLTQNKRQSITKQLQCTNIYRTLTSRDKNRTNIYRTLTSRVENRKISTGR